MTIALAVSIAAPNDEGKRSLVELEACRLPRAEDMEAYERVLTDAMAGDSTLFARQDYVEEAWRIVDPVLKANTPVYPYALDTWGPADVPQQKFTINHLVAGHVVPAKEIIKAAGIGFTAGDFRRQPDPAHIARVDDRVGPVRR